MLGAGNRKDSCRWSDLGVLTMRQYHLIAFQRNDLSRWTLAARGCVTRCLGRVVALIVRLRGRRESGTLSREL